MGCTQSRIDNEESVARCKERRNLMKEAVAARNAFAAGQSGYAMALKNTGAALSDYGLGETQQTQELHPQPPMDPTSEPPPPPPPPMDNLPPPPPPLPNFSPSPIKRAISMPAMPMKMQKEGKERDDVIVEGDEEEEERGRDVGKNEKDLDVMRTPAKANGVVREEEINPVTPPMSEPKGMAWDYFFNVDNMPGAALDDGDEEEEEDGGNNEEGNAGMGNCVVGGNGGGDDEPKTPENVVEKVAEQGNGKQIEHARTAPPEFRRVGKGGSGGMSLMQVLGALDDHFLKASESAQDVSKMLEATRLHYHSNFADNRGK